MIEFKMEIKNAKKAVRQLRALEKKLTQLATYAQDVKTATARGVEEQLSKREGWEPGWNGEPVTLRKTGKSAKRASRSSGYKVASKKGARVVLKSTNNILGFHNRGTKHVPMRKVVRDNEVFRREIARLTTARAKRIIAARNKGR